MCRLFETIRIEADGSIPLLPWHLARMERSRSALFGSCPPITLDDSLQVPDELTGMVVRCRVDYDIQLIEIRFEKYIPRIIRSLSMVQADDLSYPHKFAERNRLDGLRHAAGTDEVLIVRNGMLTDASTANLVFRLGDEMLTPASPLLHGTRRQSLLDSGHIREAEIRPEDIWRYQEIYIINALRTLESPLPPKAIIR